MELRLIREPYKPDATLGTLATPFGNYFTLERPWLDNARGISCIPEGTYECRKRWSPSFKRNLYGLLDVPERGDILIHNGSWVTNSLGCILIGKTTFVADGRRGIGLSRLATQEFIDRMNFEPFTLSITRR